MKTLLLLTAGLGIVSHGVSQDVKEYKISDSKIIYVEGLINAFGNQKMNLKWDNKNYSFTTQDFLNYFMNKPIATIVGQEDYNKFLISKPSKPEDCKCNQTYKWINQKEVTISVDVYAPALSNRIFNSPLNKMLNGLTVSYNSSSRQIEKLAEDTNKLVNNHDNNGYKLLLTLSDYLSPESIRAQKNQGSTCYILVDAYEWALLNRFISEQMGNFLEQLPNSAKGR